MEEFLDYQKKSKKDLIEIILDFEYKLQYTDKESVYERLLKYWNIMKESIEEPLNNPKKSDLGLTGGDAKKIKDYNPQNGVFKNDIFKRAVFYSTAVNEFNAQSGLIVACPTAGSAGIVPGVLKAYQEIQNCSDKEISNALLVSGFLGMILFNDVTTAGADFGCQAEIGSAAAMGAAAITYLEGGSVEAIVHAFTLAIKNSLGLVCDPVGGLVEVPCVKRNGIYSSMALSCSLMALSGVRSFVSPDEVILAMQEIGNKLNKDYKETARGGLAKTRDGKEINIKMKKMVDKFFM
jgi:L-serine dehydratase